MSVSKALLSGVLVVGLLAACERSDASPAARPAAPSEGGAEGAGSARAQSPLPSVTLPAELDRVLRDYERAWGARARRWSATRGRNGSPKVRRWRL